MSLQNVDAIIGASTKKKSSCLHKICAQEKRIELKPRIVFLCTPTGITKRCSNIFDPTDKTFETPYIAAALEPAWHHLTPWRSGNASASLLNGLWFNFRWTHFFAALWRCVNAIVHPAVLQHHAKHV